MKKLTLLLCLLLIFPCAINAQDSNTVQILVPAFATRTADQRTQGSVGRRAATILTMQVLQTLRKVDPQRPGRTFGHGIVETALDFPPPQSNTEAKELAAHNQLVLWGDAFTYGDGIVIQAHLLILEEEVQRLLQNGLWQAKIKSGPKQYAVSLDLPSNYYEFAPVVLRSDIPPEIDDPSQIQMYADPKGREPIGRVWDNFAVRGRTGDFLEVAQTNGQSVPLKDRHGREIHKYIYSPLLSKEPNEIADFCSGLIRILRKDWGGVRQLLDSVVKNRNTPTAIKIDSYLYLAVASDYLGDQIESRAALQKAYDLNPYMKVTTQYLCMSYLRQLAKLYPAAGTLARRRQIISTARDLLSSKDILFPKDDPWLAQVRLFLSEADK